MTTTNYANTLIEPAEDCKASDSSHLERGGKPTVATIQYATLSDYPYEYDSDEVLFTIYASRKGLALTTENRAAYFEKGQRAFEPRPSRNSSTGASTATGTAGLH